jgi:hypothetical protein
MLRRSALFLVVCFVIGGIFVGAGVARGDIRQELLVAVKASPGSFALDGKYHYRTLRFENVEADYREAWVERGTVEFNSANHTWAGTHFDYNSQGDSGSGSNSGTYSVNTVDGSFEMSIPSHEGTIYGHGYISNGNKTLIMSIGEMYEQTIFIAVKDEGRTFNKSDLCGAYKFRDLEVHDFEEDHGDAGVCSCTLNFDGQGDWNGSCVCFESDGTSELTIEHGGHYAVHTDGSCDFYDHGDIEPNFTGHLSGDTNSLILGKGRQNHTISQLIGIALKVDPPTTHTNSDLSGIYHFQQIGLQDFETDDREADIARGALNFDGAGNFTGTFKNYDSDNISESGSSTGTYSVNSDGSFTLVPVEIGEGLHEILSGNISSDGNIITMTQSQAITGDWVSISGDITTQDGTPVCAMALANGQYMFTSDPTGKYDLSVPLDENGQITLFSFVDGFAPFKYIFTPEGTSENIDIMMLPAPPNSRQMTLTCQFDDTAENPGWAKISGQARAENGGAPLCAMVLANGQYMFSSAGNGEYELEVPLDENGQVTLFGFADGFQPYKEVLDR